VVADEEGEVSGVVFQGLALDGDGPDTDFNTNSDDAGFEIRDWTRDGEPVDDQEGGR
jgi:hypothetical protein